MKKKQILVLCTGNSCRSQMAEGYLRKFFGDKADVYSAGVETHGLNPRAVAVLAEDGIDISGHTSNQMDEYNHIDFDLVITVCDNAKDQCPFYPKKTVTIHHSFSDPAKATGTETQIMDEFRKIRDEIKAWSRSLAETFKW